MKRCATSHGALSEAAREFGVWQTSAPAAPALPMLDADLDCEIAIVGAGYTGLSTALHLAEAGQSCVVIEAREPGFGASGRNTGWLEPNWWMKDPAQIARLFGQQRARELSRWVASGPRLLDRWIERYGLQVEIQRGGLIMASDQARRAAALEAEASAWQALQVEYRYLDRAQVRRYIASDRYVGALLLTSGVTLNPLALSRELARACAERGVQMFGGSAVTAIAREGTSWRLTTQRARIDCRRLVLATDAYTRTLWPALQRAYASWRLAVIASHPYPQLGELLRGVAAFADLNLGNVFTLRAAPGDRLVTSTFAPVRREVPPEVVAAAFMRKFRRVFPGHPAPRWQYAHLGEVGLTANMLPRLASIGPQAWTAYGYSGTGINFALLLGAELARLVRSDDVSSACFPVTSIDRFALRRAVGWGLRYLHAPLARGLISRIA